MYYFARDKWLGRSFDVAPIRGYNSVEDMVANCSIEQTQFTIGFSPLCQPQSAGGCSAWLNFPGYAGFISKHMNTYSGIWNKVDDAAYKDNPFIVHLALTKSGRESNLGCPNFDGMRGSWLATTDKSGGTSSSSEVLYTNPSGLEVNGLGVPNSQRSNDQWWDFVEGGWKLPWPWQFGNNNQLVKWPYELLRFNHWVVSALGGGKFGLIGVDYSAARIMSIIDSDNPVISTPGSGANNIDFQVGFGDYYW